MLRTLGSMLTIIAFANVIGALGVLGWLVASHRMSPERIHAIRTVFAEPTYIEEARLKAEAEAAEQEALAERERSLIGTMPITADQRLAILREGEEVVRQQNERIQRETRDLLETLRRERAALDDMVKKFEAEKAAFEEMRQLIAERETSEQFRSALKVLEGLKPREATDVLQALIETGKKEQAVAYLNAMSSRNASRVMAEFRARDPMLTADLLERLRVFGIVSAGDDEGTEP